MTILAPIGQGMFIWQIPQCEHGDLDKIVARALDAKLAWVTIKLCDGTVEYWHNKGLIRPLTDRLMNAGISVWGWGWTYGRTKNGKIIAYREANIAAELTHKYNLRGFIINAERDYKHGKMRKIARIYCNQLRKQIGYKPLGLSSYRFPSVHRGFPWKDFNVDFYMPQVYWEQDYRPTAGWTQTQRCLADYRRSISATKLIIPVGPVYSRGKWIPTAKQREQFIEATKTEKCPGWCWWSWQHVKNPSVWKELAEYNDAPNAPIMPQDALERLWNEAIKQGWKIA